MTDEELKQLIESNARKAQAMSDNMAETGQELREEFRAGMLRLENIVERLMKVQEGVSNLLASLDSDRPTILRKLTSIENKVDRLLTQEEGG